MNWGALISCLVVAMLVPADVAQAQEHSLVVYVYAVEPPPEWERIYHEVEACTGMRGKFTDVHWSVSTGPWQAKRGLVQGMWRLTGGKRHIIVARRDTAVVRHEALHAILHRNGFGPDRTGAGEMDNAPEHPAEYFGRCARRFFDADYKAGQ
jgi:hypothetical protein